MQKRFRLTRNKDFKMVLQLKASASNRSFVGYVASNLFVHARVGISIRGKYGNAVARNLAKRQVRAMVQSLFDFSQNKDFVLIIRDGYQKRTYAENQIELQFLYQKLLSKEVKA